MKAIIDNLLYDTAKAEKIYSYRRKYKIDTICNNLLPDRYCYMGWEDVDIYKTKKCNFFLCCKRDDKEYIESTTYECIKDTIKELNPDKYIELFGDIEEVKEA